MDHTWWNISPLPASRTLLAWHVDHGLTWHHWSHYLSRHAWLANHTSLLLLLILHSFLLLLLVISHEHIVLPRLLPEVLQ